MAEDTGTTRTRRPLRPGTFALAAALLGGAAFVAALVLKSIQAGRAPADYYPMLNWLAPEIGLAPFAAMLGLVAVILAIAARDLRDVALGSLGGVLAVVALFTALTHVPPNAADLSHHCRENVKAITTALAQYEADHGALPPAAHWTEALSGYVHDPAVWKEPFTGRPGYALNAAIAGRSTASFAADPESVVAVFESDQGAGAAGGPELLPRRPRHYGGTIIGYVGGQARWAFGPCSGYARDLGLHWDPDTPTERR